MLVGVLVAFFSVLASGQADVTQPAPVAVKPCCLEGVVKSSGAAVGFDTTRDVSLAIMQNGRLVQATSFGDGNGAKNQIMSITKSVTSLLVGIAIDEGLLPPLDEPLGQRFVMLRAYPYRNETLRSILQQASCFAVPASVRREEIWVRSAKDAFDLLGAVQPSCRDGRVFAYSNVMPNVVSQLVEAATGASMQHYAAAKLFAPLGIQQWSWTLDDAGHTPAEAGLQLTAVDLAKIGQLLLQDGRWQGRRVVPQRYVEQLSEPSGPNPEHSLLWWLRQSPNQAGAAAFEGATLEGNGWAGQVLVIDRRRQRVTVILTRPQWAWALFNGRPTYEDAESQYNEEMKRHDAFVRSVVLR